MSTKATCLAIGLILGIAVGCALGFVIFRSEPAAVADAPRANAESGPSAGDRAGDLARAQETPRQPAAPEKLINNNHTNADGSATVAAEQAARQKVNIQKERGDGRIAGRVMDALGKPVADVQVIAKGWGKPVRDDRRNDPAVSMPLEEMLNLTIQDYERAESLTWRTTTGADGTFILNNLPDDRFSLYGRKPGFEISARNGKYNSLRAGAIVEFIAAQKIRVEISVRLPDGTAPEFCTIDGYLNARGSSYSLNMNWTPKNNHLEVVPGVYSIGASCGDRREGAEYVSGRSEIVIDGGVAPAPILLELRPRVAIRGEITFEDPDEEASATVYLAKHAESGTPDIQKMRRGGKITYTAGEYDFSDLKPGKYDIAVARRDGPMIGFAVVEVTNTIVRQDFKIPARRPDEYLRVRVRNSAGEPVTHVEFVVTGRIAEDYKNEQTSAVQKAPGEYWLTLSEAVDAAIHSNSDTKAKLTLQVNAPSLGQLNIPIVSGQREYLIIYENPAIINIHIAAYHPESVDGEIAFRVRNAEGYGFAASPVSESGDSTVKSIPPGKYQLELYATSRDDEGNGQNSVLAVTEVQAVSGQQQITVTMPQVANFVVKIPAASVGGRVDLNAADRRPGFSTIRLRVPASQSVRFTNVVQGNYTISYQHSTRGRQNMNITVPCAPEIEFQPDK